VLYTDLCRTKDIIYNTILAFIISFFKANTSKIPVAGPPFSWYPVPEGIEVGLEADMPDPT